MNIKEKKKVENKLAEEAARLREENARLKDDLERLKLTQHSSRKRIKESTLRESAFSNLIIQNAADGLSVCHNIPDYPYVFFTIWNHRMTEITGYTIGEINKKGWYQTMYPDAEVKARARKRMEGMRQGEDMRGEAWEITRSDGEKRIVSITTSILEEDDNTVHVLALMDDITEHKKADDALRESEERFRALTESTSDWIWEVDSNCVYTYTSPKVKDLLGYGPEEIIGKTPFDFMPPDEAERLARIYQELEKNRNPIISLVNINLHKDGRKVFIETSGVPLFNSDGSLKGYRGIDRDITERKLFEKEIKKREEELNKRVKELEDFYNMAVGREIRMIQMKKEMEKLRNELAKYKNQ
jgi:PAS domain S-box-containing protein